MSSLKRKSEKPNAELTTMQIFSKALTGGSEWCDKVIGARFTFTIVSYRRSRLSLISLYGVNFTTLICLQHFYYHYG